MKHLFLLLTLTSLTTFAALPPYYQSAREINAILNCQTVAQKLGAGSQIKSIQHVEKDDSYIVRSGLCEVVVQVRYQPVHIPGPAKFVLETSDVKCLVD